MTIEELKEELVGLKSKIQNAENAIVDLQSMRDNTSLQGKLNNIRFIENQLATLGDELGEVKIFINKFNTEDRFVELFEPKEIRILFNKSGVGINDVAGFLTQLANGEKVTPEDAHEVVNEGVEDIRVMSRLGKWLRVKALKNVKPA